MLSYDFVTNEKLKVVQPNQMNDSVAVTVKNNGQEPSSEENQCLKQSADDSEVDDIENKTCFYKQNHSPSSGGTVKRLFDNFAFIHRPQDFNPNRRSSTPGWAPPSLH